MECEQSAPPHPRPDGHVGGTFKTTGTREELKCGLSNSHKQQSLECSLEGQRQEVLPWLSARWFVWEVMAYLGIDEGHGPCSSLPLPAGLGRVTGDPWATNPGCLLGGHLGRKPTVVDVTDPTTRGGVPLHSGDRKHLRNPWSPP